MLSLLDENRNHVAKVVDIRNELVDPTSDLTAIPDEQTVNESMNTLSSLVYLAAGEYPSELTKLFKKLQQLCDSATRVRPEGLIVCVINEIYSPDLDANYPNVLAVRKNAGKVGDLAAWIAEWKMWSSIQVSPLKVTTRGTVQRKRQSEEGDNSTETAKRVKSSIIKEEEKGFGTHVYIGNIPNSDDPEAFLRRLLGDLNPNFDIKEVTVPIRDGDKHQPYGFAELGSAGEAEEAIHKLNGMRVGGRMLKVGVAQGRRF